jgi:CRP/FNR family transcriptional regulator, anaerobic regulatory protein
LKVHVPGDALGTPSMCMLRTVEELSALTDVVVSHVSLGRFAALCEAHPRLAMKFMLSVQLERVALMDRLSSIGRTSAVQRIAALILDLLERLEPLGQAHGDTFSMALTQEQIGDVVGLTSVHTNRALKALTDDGLISRSGTAFEVVNRQQLAKLAAMPTRLPHVDPPWLPRAR